MSKEHAYAYEAGYHDGATHYELDHCPSCKNIADLQDALAENDKLREQTELLVTLLRNDCDIEASWDGLRHFWSIELTDDGCLMRDRACKAEAESAKLRELVCWMYDCMDVSCAAQYPYSPAPINYNQLMKARARAHELGLEVGA